MRHTLVIITVIGRHLVSVIRANGAGLPRSGDAESSHSDRAAASRRSIIFGMPGDYADRCCVPDGDACADAGRGWRHLSLGMKIVCASSESCRQGQPHFPRQRRSPGAEPRVDTATGR